MTYLLSGSFSYDTILSHKGHFHKRILPESIDKLNVAFGLDSVDNSFGGTGGNIAYNSALLGNYPVLCSSVGSNDFKKYEEHLKAQGLNPETLTYIENEDTSHAWLFTDSNNNQITGFHSGAMKRKPELPKQLPSLWHLAPDSAHNTSWLSLEASHRGIPYYFDPGQAIPAFIEGQSTIIRPFREIVRNATGIFINEYEAELLKEYLKEELHTLVQGRTEFIIQTLGSKGLNLITKEGTTHIPVVQADKIVDPTGCGDSLRAGFIYGMQNNWNLVKAAQLGSTMGSFAIESSGGQNHKPTFQQIMNRFHLHFNENRATNRKSLI